MAGVITLPVFRATTGQLTLTERKLIVEQSVLLFEQNYVHMPLKRAMHAVDPLQRLRLIRARLEQATAASLGPELEFHREMLEIFTSVRDLHTNYVLPAPYGGMVAFLPFLVEDYVENGQRKYVVTRVQSGFTHATFKPGVELLFWNGAAMERAAMTNGNRYAGSNLEARHARGVQTLAQRSLSVVLPPEEDWVVITYRTLTGQTAEIKLDWLIMDPSSPSDGTATPADDMSVVSAVGLDIELDAIQQARKVLFVPQVIKAERAMARRSKPMAAGDLTSTMPTLIEAREITTTSGRFGYIRIRSFNMDDHKPFLQEFIRLAQALPQNGLILDVRENGGGLIYASEALLQLLTPQHIEPEPVQFISSSINLNLCRKFNGDPRIDLGPWVPSLQQTVETGAVYSNGFPITPVELCNDTGQIYHGPVMLITDALCYSATDIFAAGFQDHNVGPILGTDGNTGAGGANVWTHELVRSLAQIAMGAASPYKPLPRQTGMRISIRRTLRVGKNAGTPVEDLGVVPDQRYFMTKKDLLEDNVDLKEKAGSVLAALPVRTLQVNATLAAGNSVDLKVNASGIDRLDLYLNGRPQQTLNVAGAPVAVSLAKPAAGAVRIDCQGFSSDKLVASRRLEI